MAGKTELDRIFHRCDLLTEYYYCSFDLFACFHLFFFFFCFFFFVFFCFVVVVVVVVFFFREKACKVVLKGAMSQPFFCVLIKTSQIPYCLYM